MESVRQNIRRQRHSKMAPTGFTAWWTPSDKISNIQYLRYLYHVQEKTLYQPVPTTFNIHRLLVAAQLYTSSVLATVWHRDVGSSRPDDRLGPPTLRKYHRGGRILGSTPTCLQHTNTLNPVNCLAVCQIQMKEDVHCIVEALSACPRGLQVRTACQKSCREF